MSHRKRPFLLTLMLLSIGLRTVFGAPCCMAWEAATQAAAAPTEMVMHDHHAHHDHHEGSHDHDAHSSVSGPCCAACGPTLRPDTILLADRAQIRAPIDATPIRALQTRPPFPAYDARGPPLPV